MSLLILTAGILLFICSLSAYLPLQTLATDTLGNFMFQYLIAAFIVILLALFFKGSAVHFIFPVAALLLSLVQVFPLIPLQSGAPAIEGKPFKILQANVYILNQQTAPLQKLITDENPDVVALSEVRSVHSTLFEKLRQSYPHQEVIIDDAGPFGMAVLSKTPLNNKIVHHFYKPAVPSVEAEITINDRSIRFLSIHPFNPLRNMAGRDAEFAAIASMFSAQNKNLIITGDFNATPYTYAFKKLKKSLSLHDARRDNGISGTYPTYLPSDLLRLPIDHLLASDDFKIISHRTGADIGSDHLPMITVLGWNP